MDRLQTDLFEIHDGPPRQNTSGKSTEGSCADEETI